MVNTDDVCWLAMIFMVVYNCTTSNKKPSSGGSQGLLNPGWLMIQGASTINSPVSHHGVYNAQFFGGLWYAYDLMNIHLGVPPKIRRLYPQNSEGAGLLSLWIRNWLATLINKINHHVHQ